MRDPGNEVAFSKFSKFEVLFIHKYIAVKKLNCVFTHIMKIVKLN